MLSALPTVAVPAELRKLNPSPVRSKPGLGRRSQAGAGAGQCTQCRASDGPDRGGVKLERLRVTAQPSTAVSSACRIGSGKPPGRPSGTWGRVTESS
jgi:hypothetical protein